MVKLEEIFQISYGTKFNYNKMIPKEDGIAFVSRTSKNNGVAGFVDYYLDVEPLKAGKITVALGGTYVLSAFVQIFDFYTAQNVAVLEPIDKDMSLNEKLYYCKCITLNRHKYSAFGREANSTLKNLKVPDRSEIPQWVKIKRKFELEKMSQEFLSEGYDKAAWYLDNVNFDEFDRKYKKRIIRKNTKMTIENLREFKIGTLFNVYTGKDIILSDLIEGEYIVVSHSKKNNGVAQTTEKIKNRKLFKNNNTISLADRGNFFATVQEKDFYLGTRVKALEAKFDNCNKYILMFISIIINQQAFRFSYGRNCCAGVEDLKIKLPSKVLENGFSPDYDFMEKYIKQLNYSISLK